MTPRRAGRFGRRALLGLACALPGVPARGADGSLARVLARGTLRAGIALEDSPMAYMVATLTPDGMAVAVAELLAQGLGLGLEMVPAGSRRARLAELEAGAYDVLMTGPPVGLGAARHVMFTDPFAGAPLAVVAPRRFPLASPEAARALRIGGFATPLSREPGGGAVTPTIELADMAELRGCIASGRCDAVIVPTFVARALQEADDRLETKFITGQAWFAAALPYGAHDLHRALNQVLRLAHAEGVLQILHRGFFGHALPDFRPTF